MKPRSKQLAVEALEHALLIERNRLASAEANTQQFTAGIHAPSGKTFGEIQREHEIRVADLEVALGEVKAL